MSTLTPIGNELYTAGEFGQAAYGIYQGNVGDDTHADLTVGTVEFWFRHGTPAVANIVVSMPGDGGYWFGTLNSICEASLNGTNLGDSLNTPVNDGAWHHYACVLDGTYAKVLVDGKFASISAYTGIIPVNRGVFVGAIDGTGAYPWQTNGSTDAYDEIRISDVARYDVPSNAQFGQQIFIPATAPFTSDIHTVGLWHLDGNAQDATQGGGPPALDVPATDSNIVYSPGNWGPLNTGRKTVNPGAYFRVALLTASSIALKFDVSGVVAPNPTVMYRVDQGPWVTEALAASIPVVPSGNDWGVHVVEFVYVAGAYWQARWVTQGSQVTFLGVVSTNATTVPFEDLPPRAVIFGDSIVEGLLTLTDTLYSQDACDVTQGYAYALRESLGVDIGVVGFGGQGWGVAGSGGVPSFDQTWDTLWGSGPTRDLSDVDLAVVNMGTNDGGATGHVAEMTTVLNGILAALSDIGQVVVMEPFNGAQAASLQSAIAATDEPSRFFYADTTGWLVSGDTQDGTHPKGYLARLRLAPRLAAALRSAGVYPKVTAWVNDNGTRRPAVMRLSS